MVFLELVFLILICAILVEFIGLLGNYYIMKLAARNFSDTDDIYVLTFQEMLKVINSKNWKKIFGILCVSEDRSYSTHLDMDEIKINGHYVIMKNFWEYLQYAWYYTKTSSQMKGA